MLHTSLLYLHDSKDDVNHDIPYLHKYVIYKVLWQA